MRNGGRKSTSYDFLALQRNAIILLVPEHDPRGAPDPKRGRGHAHAATLLLLNAVLHATLDLSPRLRMSDFLAQENGFFVVEPASLFERSPSGKLVRSRKCDRVLVHAPNVLGLTEAGQLSAKVLRLSRADGRSSGARARIASVR